MFWSVGSDTNSVSPACSPGSAALGASLLGEPVALCRGIKAGRGGGLTSLFWAVSPLSPVVGFDVSSLTP